MLRDLHILPPAGRKATQPRNELLEHLCMVTKVFVLSSLQVWFQLPVAGQVEGELSEQPELALDLHPTGAAHVAPRVKPLAHHFLVRRQRLEPQVKDLLVEAETDEAAKLHIHLGVHGVVGEVDGLDTSEKVSIIAQLINE